MHPTVVEEERNLVSRMRAGDEEAFRTFADHYVPALYRFAAARLNNQHELTGEVVQTTLLKFIEKLETFRGEAALFTWLCAFCRNEIAGHFRRQNPARNAGNVEMMDIVATSPDPEAALLANETGNRVHDVLDHLPPQYASVLEWKYAEGLSVREIAGRLRVGEKAAESLLTRARTAFRSMYEERGR